VPRQGRRGGVAIMEVAAAIGTGVIIGMAATIGTGVIIGMAATIGMGVIGMATGMVTGMGQGSLSDHGS
jgi:UDP-3-O-[3-hydroxymyristoyl] glucosamine N-acyltransferase